MYQPASSMIDTMPHVAPCSIGKEVPTESTSSPRSSQYDVDVDDPVVSEDWEIVRAKSPVRESEVVCSKSPVRESEVVCSKSPVRENKVATGSQSKTYKPLALRRLMNYNKPGKRERDSSVAPNCVGDL